MDKLSAIYLGSQSPRRKELLTQMGVKFEVLSFSTPEVAKPGELANDYSIRITHEKLIAGQQKILSEHLISRPLLCADTEVVMNGEIYGKPADYQDAFRMLKSYSDNKHLVITSVGLSYQSFHKININKTWVHFAKMTDTDIHTYLMQNQFMDKAGAYGIQSYIGQFISKIEGCFFSVMGLPLSSVRELLNSV